MEESFNISKETRNSSNKVGTRIVGIGEFVHTNQETLVSRVCGTLEFPSIWTAVWSPRINSQMKPNEIRDQTSIGASDIH
jgi:hypothetical protein